MRIDNCKNLAKIFSKGIIKENPVFFTLLGMCPALALTTQTVNAVGLGLATLFVLLCSNIVISLLRNVIPNEVRLPCYIVIISGFVTFVGIMLKAFLPPLYDALGLFLSLIAVNCIIFGRAEVFARRNKVFPSILDGLGMGIGFTMALFILATIREILGSGKWLSGTQFEITVLPQAIDPMMFFVLPAGGFFTLGMVVALVNRLAKKRPNHISCDTCPMKAICKTREGIK